MNFINKTVQHVFPRLRAFAAGALSLVIVTFVAASVSVPAYASPQLDHGQSLGSSQGAITILGLTLPPLVVCGNEGLPECTFYDVFRVFKNLITTMFYLCIPIVFFMLAYAAFVYLTAGDSEDGHTTAKNILTYTGWGFFWMCTAWLIVRAILEPLINTTKGFRILEL
jgi:hypothetical protein